MLRVLFVAVYALVSFAASAFAQELLSPSQFRDAGVARIMTFAPDARVELRDELGVTLVRPGQSLADGMQLNFDNAYAIYRDDPSQFEFLIDRWSRLAVEPPMERSIDRIVSILRPQTQIEAYSAVVSNGPTPGQLISRPFAGDLVEVLVFDSAEAVAYMTADQLTEIGLSLDEAWTLALINIPTRMGALEEARFDELPGLVLVGGGNGLAPSNLVGPAFCSGPQARNLVFVSDREGYFMAEPAAAETLYGFADWLIRSGESASSIILECRGGQLAAIDRPTPGSSRK